MCVKDVVIQNQAGLHARPATFFIQKANEFKCSIWVEMDDRKVNAKSLLGVLSLDNEYIIAEINGKQNPKIAAKISSLFFLFAIL